MIKKIIFVIILTITTLVQAQENTASPYSYYGIGKLRFQGTEASKTMGGLNITGDSIAVNLLNPASYSHLKLTSFSVGGTTSFTALKNSTNKEKAQRTSFDYLTIGIPMGKIGAAFGIKPFSAVGYKITTTTNLNNLEGTKDFLGSGNVNTVFLGGSYSFSKNLSIGVDFNYYFGTISDKVIEKLNEIQLQTRGLNTTQVNGFNVKIGALYNKKLTKDITMYSSFSFTPETTFNLNTTRNTATVNFTTSGYEVVTDENETVFPKIKTTIPTNFTIGTGIGKQNKWLVGAEMSFTENSKLSNRFSDVYTAYKNGQRLSIGGYYIPKFDAFSNYFKRVVYRAGFKYENTGLELNGKAIKEYGINFGVGLPVGVSKVDIGFEVGKMGTTTNNLIQENFFNISIGLSLSDKWFKKILID